MCHCKKVCISLTPQPTYISCVLLQHKHVHAVQCHVQVGKTVDRQLSAMGGQKLAPFGCGDEDGGKMQEQFQSWAQGILEAQSKQTSNDAFVEPVDPIITQEVSSCTSSYVSPVLYT